MPGWPPYVPDLSAGQSLIKPAEELAELWRAEVMDLAGIGKTNIQSWKTYQSVYFLEKILEKSPLPRGRTTYQELHRQGSMLCSLVPVLWYVEEIVVGLP